MKKVLKFAWMALFALPMIGMTSCSNDDENTPAKVTIDNVQTTYNYDQNSATLSFEVTATGLADDDELIVTYTLGQDAPVQVTANVNDVYTCTIGNLEPANIYNVTILATDADGEVSATTRVELVFPLFGTDYAAILGMTRAETSTFLGLTPNQNSEYYEQFYDINTALVKNVIVFFTDFDTDENGDFLLVDNAPWVTVNLQKDGVEKSVLLNYFKKLYEVAEFEEEGYIFTDGAMEIAYNDDENAPSIDYYSIGDGSAEAQQKARKMRAAIRARR